MLSFISGALMFGCIVAGLFFIRFWRDTKDRFFLLFGTAFWILGLERLILHLAKIYDEVNSYMYLLRLIAHGLIILAIIDKNRSPSTRKDEAISSP